MKKSVKPLLSLSLAATLLFGITACSAEPPIVPSPTNTESSSPTTSPTATPSVKPTTAPVPKPSSKPTATPSPSATPDIKDKNAKPELQSAQEAFPKLDEKEGKDTKEAQLALYNASRYINTIYNSGHLANGSWHENGIDANEVFELYGTDWSESYRAFVESLIDDYKNADDEDMKETTEKELLIHFLFYNNEDKNVETSPQCENSLNSCLHNEQIDMTTDLTYMKDDDGTFYVDAKFVANLLLSEDGVEGFVPVTYDVRLVMIKNPYPDEENLRYSYIVDDLGGSWESGGWRKGEPSE